MTQLIENKRRRGALIATLLHFILIVTACRLEMDVSD